jgi:hypothetical protein
MVPMTSSTRQVSATNANPPFGVNVGSSARNSILGPCPQAPFTLKEAAARKAHFSTDGLVTEVESTPECPCVVCNSCFRVIGGRQLGTELRLVSAVGWWTICLPGLPPARPGPPAAEHQL